MESVSEPPPLRHTLQTWQGMVCNLGLPQERLGSIPWENVDATMEQVNFPQHLMNNLSKLCGESDYVENGNGVVDSCLNQIATYVRENQMPINATSISQESVPKHIRNTIQGNVFACTRKNYTAKTLKSSCKKLERFDIEQAAGIIISFLGPQIGSQLIPYLSKIIFNSHMWLEETSMQPIRKSYDDILEEKWTRFTQKIDRIFKLKTPAITTTDLNPTEIIQLLQRVRRNRPHDFTRPLHIPETIYQRFSVEIPPDLNSNWLSNWPTITPPTNAVILSKHHFRIINNLLQRNEEKSNASSLLRREINRLDKESKYGGGSMEAILNTNDPIALAFNFIVLQRRLQLKVVSDLNWTTFLKKGEGNQIWQNDWATLSSFEHKLFEMASAKGRETDWECLLAVTTPQGFENHEFSHSDKFEKHCFEIITRCCQLMEAYVNVHGHGNMDNLTYKSGMRNEPRGPVAQYNSLCDILFEKKCALLSSSPNLDPQLLPTRCQKFLAKDIMHWNNSWKDDAFADGKIPGWFGWLTSRREIGEDCPSLFVKQLIV